MRKLKKFLYKDDVKSSIVETMLNKSVFNTDANGINDKKRYFYKSKDKILALPEYYKNTCPHRLKDSIEALSEDTLLRKSGTYYNDFEKDLHYDFKLKEIVYFSKQECEIDVLFHDCDNYVSNIQLIYLGKEKGYDVLGLFRSFVSIDKSSCIKDHILNSSTPLLKGIFFYEAYFIKKDEFITYNASQDRFSKYPKEDISYLDEKYFGSNGLTVKEESFDIIKKYTKKDFSGTKTYKLQNNPINIIKKQFINSILKFNIDELSESEMSYIKENFNGKTMSFFKYNVQKKEMYVYAFVDINNTPKLETEVIVSATDFTAKYRNNNNIYKGFPDIFSDFISLDSEKDLRFKFEALGFNKYNIHDLYMEMFQKDHNSMNIWENSFPTYISKYPKLELLLKDKNKSIIVEIFERGIEVNSYLDLSRKKPNQIYMLNNNKINILNAFMDDYGYSNYTLDMLIVLNLCDNFFGDDYDYEVYEKLYLLTSGGSNEVSLKYIDTALNISFMRLDKIPVSNRVFFNYYYDNIVDGSVEESMFSMIYSDYINFAMDLELELTNNVLLPKYLLREHDVLSDLVSKHFDEIETKKFIEQMEKASYLKEAPKDKDFTVILPTEPIDLINEGNSLHHCVGGYVNRVSNSSSIILFVRRKTNIEKPLYTLEYKYSNVTKKLVRGDFRGSYNSIPSQEALDFVDRFEKHHNIR